MKEVSGFVQSLARDCQQYQKIMFYLVLSNLIPTLSVYSWLGSCLLYRCKCLVSLSFWGGGPTYLHIEIHIISCYHFFKVLFICYFGCTGSSLRYTGFSYCGAWAQELSGLVIVGWPSVLAWRIPGTGEPGGLSSLGSHRVEHNWSDLAAAAAARVSHLVMSDSSQPLAGL